MYKLAFKKFILSKSVIPALILFLAIGTISIFIGKQFLEKQQQAVHAVKLLQREQIARNVEYNTGQFGLLMYYLKFAYIKPTEPIAALAIGQQDINTSVQYVNIRGLEAQRYDTDLNNPYHLQTGNFDLSFVILFLFPLLIVVFCFNCLSEEKEGGTWSLTQVQTKNPINVLLQKFAVRYWTVLGLLLVLLLSASCIIDIPFDKKLLFYSIISILYITGWFAICWFVISLHKSSNMNALILLSLWLFLCLLSPAAINNLLTARYPVKNAYSMFLKQRDGYHTKWDVSPDSTINAFFEHYPQYKNYIWKNPKFNYMWFYSMQQLGDDEALGESRKMMNELNHRENLSRRIAYFLPTMHTQLAYTDIASTGLNEHLRFLDSTAIFHEQKRLYFYPKIFGDSLIAAENWPKHQPQYYRNSISVSWFKMTVPFILLIVLAAFGGRYFFAKHRYLG